MKYFYIFFALVFTATLSAEGYCRKCEIMKKYHSENPGSHTYYEDYLNSLDKKSEEKKASEENLPDDVRQIMKQEKVSSPGAQKK